MRVWIRLILWAAFVGLQFYVAHAFPLGYCGFGVVDPGGPIWMIHVSESDIWVHALLMLSVMVLIPLGLCGEVAVESRWQRIEIVSACLLGLSLLVSPVDPRGVITNDPLQHRMVPVGFLCAMPWLLVRARGAAFVLVGWIRAGVPSPADLCRQSAQIFPAIGAAWLVAHRANWTPLGFDPLIVLLTAAHFHHAGFTLPLIAGWNAKAQPGCWTHFSCVAILIGVPLVAVGITCTHFGELAFAEPFGVAVLVLGALGVAVFQMLRGIELHSGLSVWTRICFVLSGSSLLIAMILALSFGLRHLLPWAALTMPQMWMIHGTLNTFGFGLCGLLGWQRRAR